MMVEARPGSITGKMTVNSARRRPHPSICAASSMERGTPSKKPRSVTTEKGIIMLVYSSTMVLSRLTMPSDPSVWYSGISRMNMGTICVNRKKNSSRLRPRNLYLAMT